MSESTEATVTEAPAPAPKPTRQHRRPNKRPKRQARAAKPSTEDKPIKGGEFAGVSATACCTACTPERCVISTVGVCKHPYKTGDSGCGPITIENRHKVRKLIKHQLIDLRG